MECLPALVAGDPGNNVTSVPAGETVDTTTTLSPLHAHADLARRRDRRPWRSVLPFGRVRGRGMVRLRREARTGTVVFSTRRAVRSGASLQHADRQVSGEHRLARITRQPCIGLGGHLRTIAGLLQLHHEVVIR